MGSNVRYAVRSLLRAPGFTTAAVLTLALGTAATTTIFSVAYGVLLRPEPYPNAGRLVRLWEGYDGAKPLLPSEWFTSITYHRWKDSGTHAIDALEVFNAHDFFVGIGSRSDRVIGSEGTPGVLALLGARAQIGRLLTASDTTEGHQHVVVISDAFWHSRFGADPHMLGQTFRIGSEPYTVVGITQPGFEFLEPKAMFWIPVDPPRPTGPVMNPVVRPYDAALARLAPGATVAAAAAEGTAIARRIDPKPLMLRAVFGEGGPAFVRAATLTDYDTSSVRRALQVLMLGAGCILLIACVNVGNLLLSRGAARRRELGVRAALGASRRDLAIHLVTEGAVLAACGGAIGTLAGYAVVSLAPRLAWPDFPRLHQVRMDTPVLLFALAITTVSAVACGVIPVLGIGKSEMSRALRAEGHSGTVGEHGRTGAARAGLLCVESAFAVVLVITALLLGRTLVSLLSVDPGYTADHAVAVVMQLPPGSRAASPVLDAFLEQVRALPGVTAAGYSTITPLGPSGNFLGFPVPGRRGTPEAPAPTARARAYNVTPGFEAALGLRLHAGRFFTPADEADPTEKWVVSEEFARQYLDPDPVARRYPWNRGKQPIQLEIIGVVANVLQEGNDARPQPEIYTLRRPSQASNGPMQFVVRTNGDPSAMSRAITGVARQLAPDAAIKVTTLDDRVSESVARPRLTASVFIAFASVALLLTTVGLWASLMYQLALRRREFGVRVAVGAQQIDLIRLVVRQGLTPVILGIVLGVIVSAGVTGLMRSLLFGVRPLDATSFVGAPALLLFVATMACLAPARRAARVDPVIALRAE